MAALPYLDTSAAVPVFVREPATERIRAFLGSQGEGKIAISLWVATEFASALALKLRTGAVDKAIGAEALAKWRQFTQSVQALDIEASHFEEAARICLQNELGLRAGDALHLAVASAHGCTLVTLDERMAKAARELGVPVAEI